MRAAVWHHPHWGPSLVGLLPKNRDQSPAIARIPYKIPPGPRNALLNKGQRPSWEEWAQHLAEALPYHGRWTVEDVPDGMSAHQVLGHVREQAISRELDSSQPPVLSSLHKPSWHRPVGVERRGAALCGSC